MLIKQEGDSEQNQRGSAAAVAVAAPATVDAFPSPSMV